MPGATPFTPRGNEFVLPEYGEHDISGRGGSAHLRLLVSQNQGSGTSHFCEPWIPYTPADWWEPPQSLWNYSQLTEFEQQYSHLWTNAYSYLAAK